LDKCLEKLPEENVPFDYSILTICASYYELGETSKANALAAHLFDIYERDLKIYAAQQPLHISAYGRDIGDAKEILKRLTDMARQARQEKLYDDFVNRISQVLTKEDLESDSKTGQ